MTKATYSCLDFLGIGTNAPGSEVYLTSRLTVNGNVDVINKFGSFLRIGDRPSDSLLLQWDSNEKMGKISTQQGFTFTGNLILQGESGNVGIGTVNPKYKLSIIDSWNQDRQLQLLSSRDFNLGPNAAIVFGGKYNSAGNFRDYAWITGAKENSIDGSDAGILIFVTRPAEESARERMRITSDGNVGIGTITRELLRVSPCAQLGAS